MATPEDIKANAEFIKMAHQYVPVPGGTNNNNYANVELIVDIAQRVKVLLLSLLSINLYGIHIFRTLKSEILGIYQSLRVRRVKGEGAHGFCPDSDCFCLFCFFQSLKKKI